MNIVVVGRGRVGSTLARELSRVGHDTKLVASGYAGSFAKAAVVIIAVRDPGIAQVSSRVASTIRARATVLHCAGKQGPGLLSACKKKGASVAVMHPMVSIADKKYAPSFESTTFVLDGDTKACTVAARLVRGLGAYPLRAHIHGASYHAAPVLLVGGALGHLIDSAQILRTLGMSEKAATRALGALLRSVGENVLRLGLPKALTGPIVRGDVATVDEHLAALSRNKRVHEAYIAMATRMIDVAKDAGLDAATARALRQRLRNK